MIGGWPEHKRSSVGAARLSGQWLVLGWPSEVALSLDSKVLPQVGGSLEKSSRTIALSLMRAVFAVLPLYKPRGMFFLLVS